MRGDFKLTRVLAKCGVMICLVLVQQVARGEVGAISRFVAPAYPALARQAMISGRVVMRVAVAADGKIDDVEEEASAHPLLSQEAKAATRQWLFEPHSRSRSVSVTVFFGFSGATREINPVTAVKADFAASSIRVYVTTDGVPTVRP
jgi:TonB family protein